MRRWKPQFSIGRWVALLLLLATFAGCGYLGAQLAQALNGPPETWRVDLEIYGIALGLFALLLIGGSLAYRIIAAFTLAYELDRNGLYVVWLGNRAVIPLDQVISVDLGVPGVQMTWGILQRIGYYWGQARTGEGQLLHLFATRPPAKCLVIYTPDAAYAISPEDHEGFVQDLEQRRNLGATKPLTPAVEPGRIFLYAFWNDATVRMLLLIALGLNLLALGLLSARYPELGATLQMRFDATGGVTELRPRHQVLFIPLAAFGLSLLNTVLGLVFYRRQLLGARLLQGASVIVQVLFGIALATIIY